MLNRDELEYYKLLLKTLDVSTLNINISNKIKQIFDVEVHGITNSVDIVLFINEFYIFLKYTCCALELHDVII